MAETNRVYKRKECSVPFLFTAEEYPPVASATQALPMSDAGMIIKKEHTGTMKNSSFDGFCFKTDSSIEPGTELTAKAMTPSPMKLGSGSFSECRTTVKWCMKNDTDPKNNYEVGVKRLRDVALPIMNFKNKNFALLKFF